MARALAKERDTQLQQQQKNAERICRLSAKVARHFVKIVSCIHIYVRQYIERVIREPAIHPNFELKRKVRETEVWRAKAEIFPLQKAYRKIDLGLKESVRS